MGIVEWGEGGARRVELGGWSQESGTRGWSEESGTRGWSQEGGARKVELGVDPMIFRFKFGQFRFAL